MKKHNVEQGSKAWHQLRTENFCASDSAAMMGDSKYKSRNQLLHEKKTGQKPEVSDHQQALFDKGHETEEAARKILEMEHLEDYAPVVCSIEIDGLNLLASLDGFSSDERIILEHKLWNEILAENVRNEVLDPSHYWQLEHQLLVTQAQGVLFVVSDGTSEKRESFYYHSVPERREQLIAGWKQFASDLESYTPKAKVEAVVAAKAEAFPVIQYEVAGSLVTSNVTEILPLIKARAEQEMNRTLETDQDFADKENFNKEVKKTRKNLKDVREQMTAEFTSLSEVQAVLAETDSVLQKLQAHGEKQVKDAKEEKKQAIKDAALANLHEHVKACDSKLGELSLCNIIGPQQHDWDGAMKNKRTLDSLQNAVDSVLAKAKIEIDQAMAKIVPNQIFLQEHATKYSFLFADVHSIIKQDIEPFQAIVKSRIADHVKAEEEKAEAMREQIRLDEERKAKEKVDRAIEEERLRSLREEAASAEPSATEEAEIVEEVKPEPKEEKKVAQFTSPKKAHEPTLSEDIGQWAIKHGISDEAIHDLRNIMTVHNLRAAS